VITIDREIMIKRKIAVFTGNRAEFGLQYPIIQALDNHPEIECYLLVSGAHLQEDFGYTKKEIEKAGFEIHAEVDLGRFGDSVYGTTRAIGTGILSLSAILDDLRPDFLVVYADRFEGFSAVITGSQMNIPIAHIEGGDLTEGGALDDSVRHAMTKLSHIHFCTNDEAYHRILNLGEEEWRVYNVGFSAIDLLADGNFASPEEISEKFSINLKKPLFIVTQHSVTTEYKKAVNQVKPVLEAVEYFARHDVQVIITYPNNDAGGKQIIAEIDKIARQNIPNVQVHNSVGRYNYHGFLNICGRTGLGACVGNSSSGIKETPFFGVPTVNIGSRQEGRLRSSNVIDADYSRDAIVAAIKKALNDIEFRNSCKKCHNPYGSGNSGNTIAGILAEINIDYKLLRKRMMV